MNSNNNSDSLERTILFSDRESNSTTLTMDQAFAHMVKAMLGTGLLSLPYAFKSSGLYVIFFIFKVKFIIHFFLAWTYSFSYYLHS